MEFGAKGLEGASTRGIAAAAGTAMSSITYHYGGKEGLYLAAADYIAAQLGGHMSPDVIEQGLPQELTPDAARALIHDTIARFVETMAAEHIDSWSLFIVREQMAPTEAFERIYGGLMGTMLERLSELVCIATGNDDVSDARVVVLTLIGQVIVLRASRATVLKLMRRSAIDAEAIALLAARIAANTDAILDRLIAERQELP